MTLCVVKLGGSLADSDELAAWLDVIANAGAGKVVLVPGGGRWADAVREAQKREGFHDRVAHRQALGAMETFGRTLCKLRGELVEASSEGAIRRVLATKKVAVWLPTEMVLADASIPQNWDVTSDSLAAWLAGQCQILKLALVKSFPLNEPQPSIDDMARRGWVDRSFSGFSSRLKQVRIFGVGDQKKLAQWWAA